VVGCGAFPFAGCAVGGDWVAGYGGGVYGGGGEVVGCRRGRLVCGGGVEGQLN